MIGVLNKKLIYYFFVIEYYIMNNKFSRHKINGNGLKSNTFKWLLEALYSGNEEVEGFVLDKSISSNTSKV